MNIFSSENDTICAIATPAGVGGLGVIRVSGAQATKIFRKLANFFPENPDSHRAYYGTLKSVQDFEDIDEVIATFFKEGRSFSGQDTVEISCHGSPAVLKQVLNELVLAGARLARPGEFTFRAFSSGRIDLAQAEGVLDLIESQNSNQSKNALRQLKGEYSKTLLSTLDEVTRWSAHIEADIDFSEDELETLSRVEILAGLDKSIAQLEDFLKSAQFGKILKEGFQILLTGAPNVGKSSLLNAVLAEERAIVTEIPGTTRDLVEAWVEIDGIKVSITDSAGLRESQDRVEVYGIEKARSAAKTSDLVFYVVQCGQELSDLEKKELSELRKNLGNLVVVIANKADLGAAPTLANASLVVSAFDVAATREIILQEIRGRIQLSGSNNEFVITRARHLESIQQMLKGLKDSRDSLAQNLSLELVALGMKEALSELHLLLGSRLDEQVIDRVFKEFCLGK